MAFRYKGIPKLLEPGKPFLINGERAFKDNLKGVFYSTDMHGVIRKLTEYGVKFTVRGGPTKGIRSASGRAFKVMNLHKAWLFEDDVPAEEIYDKLTLWKEELGSKMHFSAASTFGKMSGKIKWLEPMVAQFMRASYHGGIQWSRPGVYTGFTTCDMNDAYAWAMHRLPLPSSWSMNWSSETITDLSLVAATVTTKGSVPLPVLPYRTHMPGSVYNNSGDTISGYWMGADILAAEPFIKDIEIHWIAYGKPSWTLSERCNLFKYDKPLRKRLSLVGYGINAQSQQTWVGVYAQNYYQACEKHRHWRLQRSNDDIIREGDGIWWRGVEKERPYVRIDWGAIVTARVRKVLLREAHDIIKRGGTVARIYVDSIGATLPVRRISKTPGEWKIEATGNAIIGPPGICLIGDKLKRSGVPVDQAAAILNDIRMRVMRGQKLPDKFDWSGYHQHITGGHEAG